MDYMMRALSAVILAAVVVNLADGVAVMSVDLGSEWMKVAIVSPGVPMEIALNKESKRKTPAVVSFRDGERAFGEDAQTVGVRFPRNAYTYLLDLLGKRVDHPAVQLFQRRFAYYEIVPDPDRGTVLFKHDEETSYSVEELVAMLLHKGREFAVASAGQPVNEAVITVPGFFNQAERNAVLQAAQLADIKVLQLINDYTAVALNYGIFRRKDFNESAQYVMFYDMGASSTTATVVSYQLVKHKDRGIVENTPQVSVLGVGYDRTLGGLEMQLRLRDHLGKKFNEMKKTSKNVFDNPRAMAKLFKEAGRVKNVLSANVDHFAQIEGLLDEIDFKTQVTREELETLCADLFERVKAPVERALLASGLTMEIISQVVLVGAGTRVPKVQEQLTAVVNTELAKNLNTDEAAAMGAVYRAADLSAGFKVKKFITKDAVVFPIQVTFDRESSAGASGDTKPVKRTLFGPMNPYPQKKILTFNKHQSDFEFTVHYADLDHLPQHEIQMLGALNLSTVSLSGVGDALGRHRSQPNVESKGIKAHFQLDDSGVLHLTTCELVLERTVGADGSDDSDDQSPLSKLGDTISKLFTGPEEALKENLEKPVHEEPEETKESSEQAQKKEEGGKQEGEGAGEEKKNATATKEESAGGDKNKKPKVVVVKELINVSLSHASVLPMADAPFQASLAKIEALNRHDQNIVRRESALNALESYAFDTKNKLDDKQEFKVAATAEEAQAVAKMTDEVMEWLEEEGFSADAETLEKKLADLKTLTRPVRRRVKEARERPEAVAALLQTLNGSRNFLTTIRNVTGGEAAETDDLGRPMFTAIEMDMLDKAVNDTQDWLDKMLKEQDQLPASENPVLTVKALVEKMGTLDREVKYLVNKAKIWRPKKKEDTTNTTSTKTGKESESTRSSKEAEKEEKVIEPEEKIIEPSEKQSDGLKKDETSSTNKEKVIEPKESEASKKSDQRTEESTTKETKQDDKHTEL